MLFLEHLQQCAEYVTLDSKIKCLCLAVFFGGNPTNKTQTAYTWATTNTKPPGPIIVIDQREILSPQSGAIYYTLFGRCTTVLRLSFTSSHGKLHEFGAEKLTF
jgi:hypothetical protein